MWRVGRTGAGVRKNARERSDEVHGVEGLGGVSHSKEGGRETLGRPLTDT